MQSITAIVRGQVKSFCWKKISTTSFAAMPIKAGEKVPNVTLYEQNPGKKVSPADLWSSGKHVVFAVPGAFTPTCSQTHLPSYVANVDELRSKGIASVSCIAVNDPFVMDAWGKSSGVDGKIRMLADTLGEFTKAMDLELDATAILGNVRSKRYSMLIEDGIIKEINVEPDSSGATCTLAPALLENL